MKLKKLKLMFLIVLVVSSLKVVKADCDYSTQANLNAAAANVSANYEITQVVIDLDGVEHPEVSEEVATTLESGYVLADVIHLRILNVPDSIYFTIENEEEGIKEVHKSSEMQNGEFKFKVPDFNKVREYKVKIFSNESACIDTELRTITITTPKFNEYSMYNACDGVDKYYCQKYVTTDINMNEDKLYQEFNETLEQEEKTAEAKKNNLTPWLIASGALVGVALIFAIAILIKRKKEIKF